MQDPNKEPHKDEAKRDGNTEKAKRDDNKEEAEKDARKEAHKDEMKKAVMVWLQEMHDWACNNFVVCDRASAIDDYAKKTYGLTVTTVTQVSHQELSGTVYNMESTCHGIAYKSSWLSMTNL